MERHRRGRGDHLGLGGPGERAVLASFAIRAARDTPSGSNPEELLAASLAACFTMTLADRLTAAGHPALSMRTEARAMLVRPERRWSVPAMRMHCTATSPGSARHSSARSSTRRARRVDRERIALRDHHDDEPHRPSWSASARPCRFDRGWLSGDGVKA